MECLGSAPPFNRILIGAGAAVLNHHKSYVLQGIRLVPSLVPLGATWFHDCECEESHTIYKGSGLVPTWCHLVPHSSIASKVMENVLFTMFLAGYRLGVMWGIVREEQNYLAPLPASLWCSIKEEQNYCKSPPALLRRSIREEQNYLESPPALLRCSIREEQRYFESPLALLRRSRVISNHHQLC